MSEEQVIYITIDTNGDITTQTKGFGGKSCIKAAQFLKEGFGINNVINEQKTSEYYGKEVSAEVVANRN